MRNERIEQLNNSYNERKTIAVMFILMGFIVAFSLPLIANVGNIYFILGLIISIILFLSIAWHWFKHQNVHENMDNKLVFDKITTGDRDSFDKQLKWGRLKPLTPQECYPKTEPYDFKLPIEGELLKDNGVANVVQSVLESKIDEEIDSKYFHAKAKRYLWLDNENRFETDKEMDDRLFIQSLSDFVKEHPDEVKDFIKKNKKKK